MYEPYSRVVRLEPDRSPTAGRNPHRVPLRWVNKVVLLWILINVKVSDPPPDDEEIVAMEMDGMVIHAQKTRSLQNDFQADSVRNHQKLGAELGVHVRRHRIDAGEVEGGRRFFREIGGEDAGCYILVVRLQYGLERTNEGLVVHGSKESFSMVALADLIGRTILEIQADDGHHALINRLGNVTWVLSRSQAPELAGKFSCKS